MKKIFSLIIFFLLLELNLFAQPFFYTDNSESCQLFIKGFLSQNINEDFILTCGNSKILSNKNLPIYAGLIDFCYSNAKIKLAELKFPSLKTQMKIIDKLTHKKNIYGILLSSDKKIKCLKEKNLKNLKIFQIKKNYEIPYIVNQAVNSCDIIILYPENFLQNSLIVEFIIKKIILSGKSYIAYNKKFLELGAKAVFTVDYLKEGEKFALIIKNKSFKEKIIEPEYFKVYYGKKNE